MLCHKFLNLSLRILYAIDESHSFGFCLTGYFSSELWSVLCVFVSQVISKFGMVEVNTELLVEAVCT